MSKNETRKHKSVGVTDLHTLDMVDMTDESIATEYPSEKLSEGNMQSMKYESERIPTAFEKMKYRQKEIDDQDTDISIRSYKYFEIVRRDLESKS